MDRSTILKDKVVSFLEELGIDVTYKRFTTDNVMIRCPFAAVSGHEKSVDRNPSLGLKITSNGFVYNCFTCHRKGHSLIDFVKRLQDEGVLTKDVSAHELQNSIQVKFPQYDEEYLLNKRKKIPIVEDYIDRKPKNKLFLDYCLNKRKLDEEVIDILKLWYDVKHQKILFPCYDGDKYIGSVYHSIVGEWPKYSNDFNVENSLYLEWLIKGRKIIVVEGMFDVAVIYKHLRDLKLLDEYSIIGTYGAEVTHTQVKKLIEYSDIVILAGDNDLGGIAMERDIFRIAGKKLPGVFRMRYDAGDPAKLTQKAFKKALENNISTMGSMYKPSEVY